MYITIKTKDGSEDYNLELWETWDQLNEAILEDHGIELDRVEIIDHDIPEHFLNDNHIDPDLFEILRLAESGQIPLDAAIAGYVELDIPVDSLINAYYGEGSMSEFAESFCSNVYDIPESFPYNCIDWDEAAEVLEADFTEVDGYIFSNNY